MTDVLSSQFSVRFADFVSVKRRFLRSVALERDFYSDDSLQGYLVTESAKATFARIAAGIDEPAARAVSLTGPYGTGKSGVCAVGCVATVPK